MALLARWDPFQDLVSLERDVSRLFSDIGVPWAARTRPMVPTVMMPSVDVVSKGEDLLIRADLPGIKPEDIDISVTEGTLTIKGERRESSEAKEEDYLLREASYGSFERSLRLPKEAEIDKMHAEYHDGMLEITVPKAAMTAPEVHHVPVHSLPSAGKPREEHH